MGLGERVDGWAVEVYSTGGVSCFIRTCKLDS